MNAGKLNRRVDFYALEDVRNDLDMLEQEPMPIFSAWARIEGTRGKEYYEAQRVNNEDTFKITIRYRKGVTADMLIKYAGDTYYINSIVDPFMAHTSLEIYCTVTKRGGVNDG